MKRTITLLSLVTFSTFTFAQELGYGRGLTAFNLNKNSKSLKKLSPSAEGCSVKVINETDEENGVFIIGNSGQKAAVDITLAPNQQIKINSISVTLSSKLPPSFVRVSFYNNVLSTPDPEDEVEPSNIPNEIILKIDDSIIESMEDIGYEPMHQFVIRKVNLKLKNPIVLDASMSNGPIWMRTMSDANAWATNNTGEVVGESVAMGSDKFGWFQLKSVEGLYEINAECSFLNVSDSNRNEKVNTAPNPAQEYIEYINLKNIKVLSTEIYDESGRLVKIFKEQQSKMYIGDLKKGIYIIKAKTSNHITLTDKLIKN